MRLTGTLFLHDLRVAARQPSTGLLIVVPPVVLTLLLLGFLPELLQVQGFTGGTVWILGSVAALSGFSTSAAVLLGFWDGYRTDRFRPYLSARVRPRHIVSAFALVSLVLSLVVSLGVVLIAELVARFSAQPTMTYAGWLRLTGALLLAAVFYTGLNLLAMTVVSSTGGLGMYFLIAGLLLGFLSFSFTVWLGSVVTATAAGLLPFAQIAVLVRHPLIEPIVAQAPQPESLDALLAVDIHLAGGAPWPAWLVALVLAAWTAVVAGLAVRRAVRQIRG